MLPPFDPASAFFVAPHALELARVVGVPAAEVVTVLAPVRAEDAELTQRLRAEQAAGDSEERLGAT